MKILLLGYDNLSKYLQEYYVDVRDDHPDNIKFNEYDLVISYGYRYILKPVHIQACKKPPINLHISLLPWNKGAHPNFWAWYDNTPHGVTIHEINQGLDTGPIIYQKEIKFNKDLTLNKSYDILQEEIELLFLENKHKLLMKDYTTFEQIGRGSYHKVKDLPKFEGGWNQTIQEIRSKIND